MEAATITPAAKPVSARCTPRFRSFFPDRVAGEKVLVVNEIDHVAPGVAGDQQALDLDIADLKDLAVAQQDLFVLHPDHWQFI